MELHADGCILAIDSPAGKLMHLSFEMAYLMALMNDGILVQAAFWLHDEESEEAVRKHIRIRIEEIPE